MTGSYRYTIATLTLALAVVSFSSSAWAGGEPKGNITAFKCPHVKVTQAVDAGGGDWNYRYKAVCQITYMPDIKPRDRGPGLAGPTPGWNLKYQTKGNVIIMGKGTYRAKTSMVHDVARMEGTLTHGPDAGGRIDLSVKAKYRCTEDPFVYHSGAICTNKLMTVKGGGFAKLKHLTKKRQVPFGTFGIKLARRKKIATKSKGAPRPPAAKKVNKKKKKKHYRKKIHRRVRKKRGGGSSIKPPPKGSFLNP